MTDYAAHRVLRRLAQGEILFQANGDVFFQSRSTKVHGAVLDRLLRKGFIQQGPAIGPWDSYELTAEGRTLAEGPGARSRPDTHWLRKLAKHLIPPTDFSEMPVLDHCVVGPSKISIHGHDERISHVLYELYFGMLADDARLKSICANPDCINPYHWGGPHPEPYREIKLAVLHGDDAALRALLSAPVEHAVTPISIEDAQQLVEEIFDTHRPNSFAELWVHLSEFCPDQELAREAIRLCGGPIANRCLR